MLIDAERVEVLIAIRALVLKDRADEHPRIECVNRTNALDLRREQRSGRKTIRMLMKPATVFADVDVEMIGGTDGCVDRHVGASCKAMVRKVDILTNPSAEADEL